MLRRSKTALNDASDIGAALARMGFSVTPLTDATRESMDKALDAFRNTVKTADVALVFYAGHAIQRDGVNWLIPVDGKLDTIAAVTASAVNLDRVVGTLDSVGQFGVVLAGRCARRSVSRRERQAAADVRVGADAGAAEGHPVGFRHLGRSENRLTEKGATRRLPQHC